MAAGRTASILARTRLCQLGIAGANRGYSYVALFYNKNRLYQIEGKAFVASGQADAMRFQLSLDFT